MADSRFSRFAPCLILVLSVSFWLLGDGIGERVEAAGRPLAYYQRLLKTRQYQQLADELQVLIAEKNATREVYQLLALTYAAMGDWGRCQRVMAETRVQFGLYENPDEPEDKVASDSVASGTKDAAASAPVELDPTVYVTAGGSRYHYDRVCAGENSIPVKQSEVGFRWPCEKCRDKAPPAGN